MIYLTDNLRNNKEGFNTIVFDVDGVLVDTTELNWTDMTGSRKAFTLINSRL